MSTLALVRQVRRHRRLRRGLVVTILSVATVAAFIASLCLGEQMYSPSQVVDALRGQVGPASFIIGDLRLPRTIAGLLCGAAFGLVGALFQALLRNTLASPDVIGITAGANTAAVAGIIVLGWSGLQLTCLAVAGAIVTAGIVVGLARHDTSGGERLILMGIATGAMATAGTMWLMVRADPNDAAGAARWLAGNLAVASADQSATLAVVLVIGLPVLLANSRHLGTMDVGDDLATGLGVHVERTRALLMIVGVIVLACATAVAGPIAFVSLMCGPIAFRLCGPGDAPLVASALTGSVLVLVCDFVGANLMSHTYPVGLVTGILGGVYLLIVMARQSRKENA